MQTLKSSGEIKDFIVDNIIFNLPKVNVTSVTLLKNNVNLNVKAQSENITLNENFNSFIKTVKNIYFFCKLYYKGEKMNTNLVNKNIDTNLKIIKTKLNADFSYDLVIREFKFLFNKKEVRAFLVFFDGMINKDFVNENILKKANSTFSSKHFNENEDIEVF